MPSPVYFCFIKLPRLAMIYALSAVTLLLLFYGPTLWIRFVMWRHGKNIAQMPGTGAELAQHLVSRFELDQVEVVKGQENQDHYNPVDKKICLSPSVYEGKSLTAIAVATHEVGHAIQFCRNEPVSHLRQKYLPRIALIRKWSAGILMIIPLIAGLLKTPHVMLLFIAVGLISMLASVLMYVAILPEEYDASFKKALPILQEGYVPEKHIPAIKQVLRAAALTYVARALTEIISLWRWFRMSRLPK